MKKTILLTLLLSFTIFSMEIVNLKDGRKILVKDDYTWEVLASPKEQTTNDSMPQAKDALPIDSVTAQETETKLLTERYPELLKEDLKGGVSVEVLSLNENKDTFEFLFQITNNSSASVVRVKTDILLLDDIGNILTTITDYAYKGFNRMADTYIRVGSVKEGKLKIKKVDNWNGKVRVIIKDIESR